MAFFKTKHEFLDFAIRMAAANLKGFRQGRTSRKRRYQETPRAIFEDRPETLIERLSDEVYGR